MIALHNPTYRSLIDCIVHSENQALYGEGVLRNLSVGQHLVRVEAKAAQGPGDFFFGPFNNLQDARKYTNNLVSLGRSAIRQNSALPHIWEGGGRGNAVEVVRIYQVVYPTPAIASFAAPQEEEGSYLATPAQVAAVRAGTYRHSPRYAGQGHQLSVPVSGARDQLKLTLVARLSTEEYVITKS